MGGSAELFLNLVFFVQREFGEEAIDAEVIQQTAHPRRDGVLFPFSSFRPSFFFFPSCHVFCVCVLLLFHCYEEMWRVG